MFESILVVCTGNVCRSPIGERLLRQHLPDRHITSAGILGLEGYPADECARDVARRHGISLDGHVARRLTRRLMQGSDLIPVMEPEHLRFIAAMAPENRGSRCFLGSGWSRRISQTPIVKAVKRLNMCSGYWVKPAENGHVV